MPRIRVLIVEDTQERINRIREWFPDDVVPIVASSPGVAIGILQRDRKVIAGIMLDHDLQDGAITHTDLELSGSTLVNSIVRFIPRHIPILVHSMNPGGAMGMVRRLDAAGFSVTRIPMEVLNNDKLTSWLDDVRDNWDT